MGCKFVPSQSVSQSVGQSINQSINQSSNKSIKQYVNLISHPLGKVDCNETSQNVYRNINHNERAYQDRIEWYEQAGILGTLS